MNLRTSLATALIGLAALTGSARAAELTLYEHPNFGGSQLTLRGHTPNVSGYNFNDRASSIVVHSGRWQVCTDVDFRGYCAELVPGEYPALDRGFNDRISSAREVGSYGQRTGGYRGYGRGMVKFFAEPAFAGAALDLQQDTPNFVDRGYNDRAVSLVVSEGLWELCTDVGYAGQCRRYGPGRYPDLGWGMAGHVSSARLVRNPADAPAVMSGGWGRVPPNDGGRSRVILFADEALQGPSIALAEGVANFEDVQFNDRAGSLVVEGGSWLACSDAYFRGHCRVLAPGRYDDLRSLGLSRVISSVRRAAPETLGRRWGGAEGVQLWADRDFRGEERAVGHDTGNLGQLAFNDRARSIVVHAGEWELCSDADFRGRCMLVGPGSYPSLGGMNGVLSSLRRVR